MDNTPTIVNQLEIVALESSMCESSTWEFYQDHLLFGGAFNGLETQIYPNLISDL